MQTREISTSYDPWTHRADSSTKRDIVTAPADADVWCAGPVTKTEEDLQRFVIEEPRQVSKVHVWQHVSAPEQEHRARLDATVELLTRARDALVLAARKVGADLPVGPPLLHWAALRTTVAWPGQVPVSVRLKSGTLEDVILMLHSLLEAGPSVRLDDGQDRLFQLLVQEDMADFWGTTSPSQLEGPENWDVIEGEDEALLAMDQAMEEADALLEREYARHRSSRRWVRE